MLNILLLHVRIIRTGASSNLKRCWNFCLRIFGEFCLSPMEKVIQPR